MIYPTRHAQKSVRATAIRLLAGLCAASSPFIGAPVVAAQDTGQPAAQRPESCGNDGGLALPPGFCATVFADNLGHARHLVVAQDGVVYVNSWSGVYYPDTPPAGGFLVALKDTRGVGRADVIRRFGDGVPEGSAGGTGIAIYNDALYVEQNDRILRYRLSRQTIVPSGPPEVIVSGLPLGGDHPMHPFVIDARGNLFVDVASATNTCQARNRMPHVPGNSPCTELKTRGGIWRYDANRTNQRFSAAQRYATGIRNGEGMSFDTAGRLFITQHGRDQLGENWPELYAPKMSQELPAEELLQLEKNADYGWPTCYFDGMQKHLVLAPEYGGNGNEVGSCAHKRGPVAFFPAHWAPNDLLIYNGGQFPPAYRGGAFIAFHGSWNRAPGPQAGYTVVFQPLSDGKVSGDYIVFADGFAGAEKAPGRASFRPTGLAMAPDGALFVSDDVRGRIWRITSNGGAAAPANQLVAARVVPAAGGPRDARRPVESLPLAPGVTREQLIQGDHIFHGEASGGTCSGCHASDGKGSVVGADLTSGNWLWSDGSLEAIAATISQGVQTPKRSFGAMPPLGGAKLSPADVTAVAAYVWAIGHDGAR
jgi:glucose/arabinose dehydrogenase